jgi:hypothetical protein
MCKIKQKIMKRVICLYSFLVFTPLIISAQLSGENAEIKVVDRKDGSAVPYAVVQLIPKPDSIADFWMTDEKGIISLPAVPPKGVDSIKFSCIAYATRCLAYMEAVRAKNGKIELNDDPILLNAAVVRPGGVLTELGNLAKSQIWISSLSYGEQILAYIENAEALTGIIQKVKIYMDDFYGERFPFRLRLYSKKDNPSGVSAIMQGDDLLENKVVLIYPKKKREGWEEIDIRAYSIEFPEDGIFVGAEGLDSSYYPKDKMTVTHISENGKKHKVQHVRIPIIGTTQNLDTTDYRKFQYPISSRSEFSYPKIRIVVKKH